MTNKMSFKQYRNNLKQQLEKTQYDIAAAVCDYLWCDYIRYGLYPHPEVVAANTAIGEGHLTNPPEELAEECIELSPGSSIKYLNTASDKQKALLNSVDAELQFWVDSNRMTHKQVTQIKRNALSLCRLFAQYNRNFGRA